ncbi:protein artemis-like [Sabethes cyaneus]|uniref:protein artemis-like n=1 Tax=Sabethes cyaneus TaxID=53552 RepID=UPI00237E74AA|nr:protein artemis-like [Sabethes cyaneus]
MSTFSGLFEELPAISADRFLALNRSESVVFFLSHCHRDHMAGLELPEPLPGPLYTSPISAVFLKHRFPHLSSGIRTLEIGVATSITLNTDSESREIQVTAIPAGHCPGSVMLLFENQAHQQILYTGDFRLSPKDLRNIVPLRTVHLDAVYLDTTFFNRSFSYFPSQSESLAKISSLATEWLARDERNVVAFKLPALYGSEFLFVELYRRLKQKIHVRPEELQQYRYLVSLDDCVTANGKAARIHACQGTNPIRTGGWTCSSAKEEHDDSRHVRVIRPSALRWRNLTEGKPFCRRLSESSEDYGVCYSNHASYSELEDFLRYLRPKRVHFNVLPKEDLKAERRMNRLVEAILPKDETVDMTLELAPMSFSGIVYRKSVGKSKPLLSDDDGSGSGQEDEERLTMLPLPKRMRS